MKKKITLLFLILGCSLYGQVVLGEYQIKNLQINTKLADFGANFFGSNQIVFAAPKKNMFIKTIWIENKQPFLDLYIGDISENGEIKNKKKVKGDANTKFHEAGVTFTKDQKTVYFTGNNFHNNIVKKDSLGINNLQLFRADVSPTGAWLNIIKLPFNSDKFSTGHPALDKDEKKLYFVSDRPESLGKTDIYFVSILNNNNYSTPVRLGGDINTIETEMFPFISENGVLYFSSKGHNSLGGLDIYASKIYANSFSTPINLKPVNSRDDDFAFIINAENKGYFSSNRNSGKGDDDIYSFIASDDIQFTCLSKVYGVVRIKESNKLVSGATVVLMDNLGKEIEVLNIDATLANFSFNLPCNNKAYKLIARNKGYLNDQPISFFIPINSNNNAIEINLFLKKEFKTVDSTTLINLNPIYFDLDKWNIRSDAAIELDKVIAIMKNYPSLIIEAGSHTDSRATENYNQVLSQKRAKATMAYITAAGIKANRLTAKGYGEMQLVNECSSFVNCNEEKHQLNRRTEFKIISK